MNVGCMNCGKRFFTMASVQDSFPFFCSDECKKPYEEKKNSKDDNTRQ